MRATNRRSLHGGDLKTHGSPTTRLLPLVVAVALSVGAVVVAEPDSGAAISKNRAQAQFISVEVVQYDAIGNFITNIQKLPNAATDAQVLAISKPLGLSIEAFRKTILKRAWPKKAQSQVRILSTSATKTSAILVKSVSNSTSWRNRAVNDLQEWITDINAMDHDLGLPSFTNARFVDACQADGASVAVAMSAFHAQHAQVVPTMAILTGTNYGGPYLENWPHNAPHYTFSLVSGKLLISAPSSATPVPYRGPSSCYAAFG